MLEVGSYIEDGKNEVIKTLSIKITTVKPDLLWSAYRWTISVSTMKRFFCHFFFLKNETVLREHQLDQSRIKVSA